ncbi:MAG TPA: tetratricopeptide repeat protein [Phycisphaerales bacterium]|nr:tetratricopeptide repeat protein [Phycisphaerales bacterium]
MQAYPIATDTLHDLAAARDEARQAVGRSPDDRRSDAQAQLARVEQALAAADAANSGRTEEARILLESILPGAEDLRILFFGFQFFFRTSVAEGVAPHLREAGLNRAEELVRRRLSLAEALAAHAAAARAHTNLGLVLQFKGLGAAAEPHYLLAADIDRRIGNDFGLARDLGNLGQYYESQGDLERAETLTSQSLDLAERIAYHELAAGKLANLGDIARKRGDDAQARHFWEHCVALCEKHGVTAGKDHAAAMLVALRR